MPTSILASAAGSAASFGLSKLFGGGGSSPSAPLSGFQPFGINAGGLKSTFEDGNVSVNPSAVRTQRVGEVANTFGRQADALSSLVPRVSPGISDLRAARLGEIENARVRAVGNLRDNLARRRVLGSSFAQDAVTRAEAEFAQQSERAAAESFLQEMEMTTQLLQQQFTAERGQFQTFLDELNLEASIATGLAGKATDVLSKNAQIESLLNARAAEGEGKFIGQLVQPIGQAVGKAVGGIDFGGINFGGGSSGGTGFSLSGTGGLY